MKGEFDEVLPDNRYVDMLSQQNNQIRPVSGAK
jgi:hypothetical protein